MMALALLLLAVSLPLAADGQAFAYSEGNEVRRIGNKLQCPVCQGTSVADSPSPVAQAMREKIRTMLAEGRSEKEIIAFFRSVYGDFVLREPPRTGLASAVWWMPGIGIAAGFALLYGLVWRRRRGAVAHPPAEQALGLSDADLQRYRERIRQALRERGA